MLEEHLRSGSILKAMERSMHSARHCFSGITILHTMNAENQIESFDHKKLYGLF